MDRLYKRLLFPENMKTRFSEIFKELCYYYYAENLEDFYDSRNDVVTHPLSFGGMFVIIDGVYKLNEIFAYADEFRSSISKYPYNKSYEIIIENSRLLNISNSLIKDPLFYNNKIDENFIPHLKECSFVGYLDEKKKKEKKLIECLA